MADLVISQATEKDVGEIVALIEDHGENQIVDNPAGITERLVVQGQFNIGRLYGDDWNGEIVTTAAWQIKSVPTGRTGRIVTGRNVLLQVHRDVVTRLECRGKHFGTAITAHNQLQAQLESRGTVFASVAAMLGDGNAADIIQRRLGEKFDSQYFGANATPGFPYFMAECVDYAASLRPGEQVTFAFMSHGHLPEIARKCVKMTDGYQLESDVVHSELMASLDDEARDDLCALALEEEWALRKYGLMPESPKHELTLFGRYSDLVA